MQEYTCKQFNVSFMKGKKMHDYEEPCFVKSIKQDGRIKSLKDLLSQKNPFLPQIEDIFTKIRDCEHARYTAYILISHCEMHVPNKFFGNFVVQCQENVKDNVLADILDQKIPELQKGKNLTTLLFSVIYNTWVDEYRKYKLKITYKETQQRQKHIEQHDDFFEKLESAKKAIKQTVFAIQDPIFRITVKMWLPYIFDYHFDPLEVLVLEKEKQITVVDLQQQLQQQIEDTKTSQKKYYVSAEFIAQKLSETRACIDKRISRFKSRLQNRLENQDKEVCCG